MKNLFKFLLLGAFTFSLGVGFVGCKNYDKDIEEICQRLDDMDALIKGFTENGGKFVTDVTSATGGITVKYSDGSSAVVTIGDNIQDAYVVKNENGSWTLYAQEKGKTDYVTILLPGAASAIAKIEILGYAGNATPFDPTANISQADLRAQAGTTLDVNRAYIAKFQIEPKTGVAGTGGTVADANAPSEWVGGNTKVTKKMVLNTMGAEPAGFIIEVFPATADISNEVFTLVDNKGTVLPIELKKATPVKTQLVTRAASAGALYFVPGAYTTKTYDNVAQYDNLFAINGTGNPEVTYAIYMGGVKVSEYTTFTLDTADATAVESPVSTLFNAAAASETVGATVVNTVTGYNVKQGTAYGANFSKTGGSAANAVVDYYFEIAEDTDGFESSKFGISLNANKTQFTVSRLPDDLTLATFKMNVYKLGIDGKIFFEQIVIRPVRTGVSYTHAYGDYRITDENTKGTAASSTSTVQSANMVIDLTNMFTELAKTTYGDGTNLAQRWQRSDYGATTYQIKGLSIDGEALGSTDLAAWITAFDANGGAILGNTKADGSGTGAAIIGDGADELAQATGIIYSAKSLVFKVPYAFWSTSDTDDDAYPYTVASPAVTTPHADPAFEVGKEYAFTMDFVTEEGDYINTLTITFTPTIPALSELIARQTSAEAPGRWTGDVLNAYYKDPVQIIAGATLAASNTARTFVKSQYDIAVGAYSADITDAGGDGGFTKIGGVDTDKQWANISFVLDPNQKVGNVAYAATAAPSNTTTPVGVGASIEYAKSETEDGDNKIFEVYYQSSASSVIADGGSATVKVPNGATNAYNFAMNVLLAGATKYLDVYDFEESAYKNAAFQIKMASALERGTIKPVEGSTITMPAAGAGAVQELTSSMIKGYTYNNQPYDLFTYVATAEAGSSFLYKYTYIKSVTFEVPTEAANIYYIVDAAGTNITTEVPLVADEDNKVGDTSYVLIKSGNISGTSKTTIKVTVTDRFGRVVSENVPISITVQ